MRNGTGTPTVAAASHKLAEILYKDAGAAAGPVPGGEAAGPAGESEAASNDDDVIDAEYVDVDAKSN